MADFQRCITSPETAYSLPPEAYGSDILREREISNLFRQGWFSLGRADQLPSPESFATFDVAGQSIIVTRDKTGKLNAVANSCRHRAARLLDGSGSCKGIRCPFHSWFYGLQGKLVSAPKMDDVPGFEKSENGLISYRVEERFGFIFICLNEEAESLDMHLGDFGDIHAPWPMDSLKIVRRRELEVDCNWKAFLEVFNEYYHLPFVHPDSIDSIYNHPDPADDVKGSFATQFGSTDGTGALLEGGQKNALPPMPNLTGNAQNGARYTWVFPNMTFAANKDSLWCYEAYPIRPDRCHVVQTVCFPPETIELPEFPTKVEAYLERLDAALNEDIPALVNQQRGLNNPDAKQGRFQPDLEPNVAGFAKWYAGKMLST